MRAFWITAILIAMTASGYAQEDKGGSSLDRGIAAWLVNNQEDALPLFRQAVVEEPNNPDAYAWLAEGLRRVDSMDVALEMARHALLLSPCHPQAHTTLGDLYNPQYSDWLRASSDSTWAHAMKAVECDPEEGVAWLGLWIEGMRRGNGDIEKRALQTLASTGFITPGALAYARWILGSLPKNAILLTNGDMDTYPLVTLQQSEGFRTDIAVVNASLLNLNWYAALMTARHRINGGFSPEEIERLQAVDGDGDAANTIARQVVARWESARRKGTLKRPIAIVVGATWQEFVGDIGKYTLAGPYWIYDTGRKHTPFDGATLWKSLRTLKPEEFSGLFVSLRDRSPIRRAYAPPTAGGAVTNDLQHVVEAMQGFRLKSAEELEGWIEKFAVETGARER